MANSRQSGVHQDGDGRSGGNSKAENYQAEHDKFLEEFGKPTLIYRLVRAHFLANPRFLYRNLSYMQRKRKLKTKREEFKFSDLLKKAEREAQKEVSEFRTKSILGKGAGNYFHLVVLGFFDGQTWENNTEAKVDVQLLQILGNRRKDVKTTVKKVWANSCKISVKSRVEESVYREFSVPVPKGRYPVLAIPKDAFSTLNGQPLQSFRLAIRISIPASKLVSKDGAMINGNENYDADKSKGNSTNERVSFPNLGVRKANGSDEDGKSKRRNSLPNKDRENSYDDKSRNGKNDAIVYGGLLVIYDRDTKTNIPAEGNADLEVRLNRLDSGRKTFSHKRARREASWEVSLQPDHAKVQEYLQQNGNTGFPAKVAFAFRVSNDKGASFVSMIEPIKPSLTVMKMSASDVTGEEQWIHHHIVYSFLMGNGQKQSTESRNDLTCPWCSVKCVQLYSLLKHLEVCHPRFKFSYSRIANGARVQVSINESYDGSYTGSAFDLVAQPPGQAFGRNVPPGQRQQLFCMLAFKPKKMRKPTKFSLSEFFDNEEKNVDQNRSYMIGHNRVYHHTNTCLPIHPREIDEDSEGEPDPEWLRVKTCMMIDEFTDVNEGEKEIMKMWNHHVMHENYVGDCQISLACKKFVERFGQKVVEKNLYRNFVLHLTNLFDFGLLPAQAFHNTVQTLHGQMKDTNSVTALKHSWSSPAINTPSSASTASVISTTSTTSTFLVHRCKTEPMEVDYEDTNNIDSNGSATLKSANGK